MTLSMDRSINFDCRKIAAYTQKDVKRLLGDSGIVRNRLKIEAAIKNARGTIEIIEEFGSLNSFIWRYVDGIGIHNRWKTMSEIPARTELSDVMSRDLKKRSFSFVGSTICYAYMQSIGMVNDHVVDCFRYKEIK